MDPLGTVDEIFPDGRIVARGGTIPDVGNPVYDQKERKIGMVKRIFGPVNAPYVTVQLDRKEDAPELKGKPIYHVKVSKNAKGKRRN